MRRDEAEEFGGASSGGGDGGGVGQEPYCFEGVNGPEDPVHDPRALVAERLGPREEVAHELDRHRSVERGLGDGDGSLDSRVHGCLLLLWATRRLLMVDLERARTRG